MFLFFAVGVVYSLCNRVVYMVRFILCVIYFQIMIIILILEDISVFLFF